jgi:hypothetical protein
MCDSTTDFTTEPYDFRERQPSKPGPRQLMLREVGGCRHGGDENHLAADAGPDQAKPTQAVWLRARKVEIEIFVRSEGSQVI